MWKLNEERFQKKIKKIQESNVQKEYRIALKNERNKLLKKNHIETSKVIAIYLMVLLNAIVIYSMVAMWKFQDLTYLGVLISDIASQVVVYAIYCLKAYHGKKQEELMKFERDKLSTDLSDILTTDTNSTNAVG